MIDFRSIVSGSSGNCALFSDGHTKILIDCGVSGKKITAYLNDAGINPDDLSAILVTHEHIDHTSGVGVLSRKYNIPIIASEGTWSSMCIGKIDKDNIIEFKKNAPFDINNIKVSPFSIPHDASEPTGFVLKSGDLRFAVATDMGFVSDEVADTLAGCTAVILESNYDEQMLLSGPYPQMLKERISGKNGHLENKDAGVLATKLVHNGTKHIMLGHLSNENNSPEIAFAEVAKELSYNDILVGKDVQLSVAPRYSLSENMCINI